MASQPPQQLENLNDSQNLKADLNQPPQAAGDQLIPPKLQNGQTASAPPGAVMDHKKSPPSNGNVGQPSEQMMSPNPGQNQNPYEQQQGIPGPPQPMQNAPPQHHMDNKEDPNQHQQNMYGHPGMQHHPIHPSQQHLGPHHMPVHQYPHSNMPPNQRYHANPHMMQNQAMPQHMQPMHPQHPHDPNQQQQMAPGGGMGAMNDPYSHYRGMMQGGKPGMIPARPPHRYLPPQQQGPMPPNAQSGPPPGQQQPGSGQPAVPNQQQGPTPTLNSLLQSQPPQGQQQPPNRGYPNAYEQAPYGPVAGSPGAPAPTQPQQGWAPPQRPYSPQMGPQQGGYRPSPPVSF